MHSIGRTVALGRRFVPHLRWFSDSVTAVEDSLPILTASLRPPEFMGSRVSRHIRRDLGMLPGLIYGVDDWSADSGESGTATAVDTSLVSGERPHINLNPRNLRIPVQVDIRQVERELRRLGREFESTCYELQLDDNSRHLVFPRQVQINPLTDEPTAVNFIKLRKVNKLRIPFKFVNQEYSVDLHSRGSYVVRVNRYLDCVAAASSDDPGHPGSLIPSAIEVDVGGAKAGDILRLNSRHEGKPIVSIPEGVFVNSRKVRPDMLVAVVKAGK